MAHNVVDERTETPEQVATVIVATTKHSWWVKCEGCDNVISQPKRKLIHTDVTRGVNDATPTIIVTYSAPGARLCKECS